ncbi:MOSC domain-containing protein [Reinekea sp.]|jgi:uncharacterized protein YcbX|uniref:MOSC domain-containing protein n=1 Tax=Reinekea sp. TaxID=1970455 RepID=UPI003989D08E
MQTTIEQLYVYPVKSLAGVPVKQITFDEFGPKDDRQYLLVNSKGRFISQRSHPILATFTVDFAEQGWLVKAPDSSSILISKETYTDRSIEVTIWRDTLMAFEVDGCLSDWFSEQLNEIVYLVTFDDLTSRTVTAQGVAGKFAFADGYPLLVCNTATLDSVNRQSSQQLSMRRFRPNVVISLAANTEYQVKELRFENGGSLMFAEHCVRCNIPAIDPELGIFQRETHDYLKQALLRDNEVVFGMNAINKQLSRIQLGDVLTVY